MKFCEKDSNLNDKVKRDFGTTSIIRKIEEITDQLLKLAQVVGSSVNLVFVFKNVVGEIFRGNGNISKPVLNYIWIQLVLFFLPTLGDIISSIADN